MSPFRYDIPRRFANIIFITYFSVLLIIALKIIIRYKLSLESWNLLMIKKQQYHSQSDNQLAFRIIDDDKQKLNEIITKINLNNLYIDYNNLWSVDSYRDRFYHKKKIIFLIVSILLFNFLELTYTVIRLFEDKHPSSGTIAFRSIQKYFNSLHLIFLLFMNMIIFNKAEIRSMYVY